jgi:transcriptional regulator with XRE-family HTH domain
MASLRLKELRDAKNLNQADVAAHLKIARTTYARYESGEREMTYDAMISLAELFSVSVDYLFGRYDADPMILNADEGSLIKMYRRLDGRGRRSVQAVIEHEHSQACEVVKKSAM